MQRYDDDYTDSPTASSSSSSSSSAPFLRAEKSERVKVSDDTVLDFIPFFVFPQNFLDLRLPLAFSERADGTNFEENVFTARRDESAEALSEGGKREY
jgi:hypothetical protein